MKTNKKTILIIGGTGFIGFHLMKKFLKLGWKTSSLSQSKPKKDWKFIPSPKLHEIIKTIKQIKGNICEPCSKEKLILNSLKKRWCISSFRSIKIEK